MKTKLCDITNDTFIYSQITIPEELSDPKDIGSFITYSKRYNTVALLNLDSETDDDGDRATASTKSKPVFTKQNLEKMKQAVMEGTYTIPDKLEDLVQQLKKKYTIKDTSILKQLYK